MHPWFKTLGLVGFAAALALFAFAAPQRATAGINSPPTTEPAPTEPSEPAPMCSPPSQCTTNKSCDRICGKGLGVCVRVNSCYSACSCAG